MLSVSKLVCSKLQLIRNIVLTVFLSEGCAATFCKYLLSNVNLFYHSDVTNFGMYYVKDDFDNFSS